MYHSIYYIRIRQMFLCLFYENFYFFLMTAKNNIMIFSLFLNISTGTRKKIIISQNLRNMSTGEISVGKSLQLDFRRGRQQHHYLVDYLNDRRFDPRHVDVIVFDNASPRDYFERIYDSRLGRKISILNLGTKYKIFHLSSYPSKPDCWDKAYTYATIKPLDDEKINITRQDIKQILKDFREIKIVRIYPEKI